MSEISQQERLGKLHPASPLGPDDLVLVQFRGSEAVNDLFRFEVEALTDKSSIDLDAAIGKHFTVELTTIADGPRYFDGLLTDVTALGPHLGKRGYMLTLQPELWMLSRRYNQRIFHDQSPVDIITQVLGDHGLSAEQDAPGDLAQGPQEYVVQHGESDLDFIRRLMERFGINFYHTHALGSHGIKLTGESFGSKTAEGTREVKASSRQHNADKEHFESWRYDRRLTGGRVRVTDYNFEKPSTSLEASQTGDAGYAHNDIESFVYPGGYLDAGEGVDTAKLRLKQLRGEDNRHYAEGDVMSAGAGTVLTIEGTGDTTVDGKDFVVLAAHHAYDAQSYSTGGDGADAGVDPYRGAFEMAPKSVPLVPQMVTRRAVIPGPQVAKVIGSDEIDCDRYGRILVQFPWDLEGSGSMRCRVVQPWAGAGWGNIQIPRVGMEVLVQFLMGDPDHPVVVGCLYNQANMPPYALPSEQNTAGIRSKSVGGGGYNELVMIDTDGQEKIRMHAQHDHEVTVENDETVEVKKNRSQTVGENKSTEVGKVYTIDAKDKIELTVGQSKLMMDGSKIELSIGSSKVTLDMTNVKVETMNLQTNGVTAKHGASGMLDIKAPLVQIN
ncbi:type VI secretion system Vgr family protein [Acidimangrovimonas sediminis]|uniref:type VI secretion system Vgr family protein n=1 Tax=Acidimangrovimonas sediminis TaxID=2056283 RepID=UPI000C7F8151|nr:type VI secretion system tip protein TssI/VgrG [Acidimangrovimonas sediminis]